MKLTKMFIAVLLVLVIAGSAILLVDRVSQTKRIKDFTQNEVYTLSGGTKDILGRVKQTIHIKLYFSMDASRSAPEWIQRFISHFYFVRDVLKEYEAVGGDRIDLQVIDPKSYSEEEAEAEKYNLAKFKMPGKDDFFMFGLLLESETGKEKTIPFLNPGRRNLLEYDISKMINELIQEKRKKIGVISSLPILGTQMNPQNMFAMQQNPQRPWRIASMIQESYEMSSVDVQQGNPQIPSDIDVLMVVHPKKLAEHELFAIDQYVMKGGRLLVFVDPFYMFDRPPRSPSPYMPPPQDFTPTSELNALLEKWGCKVVPEAIVADRYLGRKIERRVGRLSAQTVEEFLPQLMELIRLEGCLERSHAVTAGIDRVGLLYAGNVVPVKEGDERYTSILQSSETGGTWWPALDEEDLKTLKNMGGEALEKEKKRILLGKLSDWSQLRKNLKDGDSALTVACALDGSFESNFPKGIDVSVSPTPPRPGAPPNKDTEKTKHLDAVAKSEKDSRIVVFADVDFISDHVYNEGFAPRGQMGWSNSFLVLNALDYLAGEDVMTAIRTRDMAERSFTRIEEEERKLQRKFSKREIEIQKTLDDVQEELKGLTADLEAKKIDYDAYREKFDSLRAELETKQTEADKEKRRMKRENRDHIERIELLLKVANAGTGPAILILIAIGLAIFRFRQAKQVGRRN